MRRLAVFPARVRTAAIAAALLFGALSWRPASSWGAGCPSSSEITGGAASPLDGVAPSARLSFIRENLRQGAMPARTWSWGWGLGLSATAVAQFGLAAFVDDRGQRAELVLGGAKSVLGLFPILVTPLTVIRDSRRLDERVAGASSSPSDDCTVLADAERMLVAAAWRESFGKSWIQHLGVFVVNLGAGLALGLGYDRWVTGALGAAVGIAVGETIIYTQPRHSVKTLARYRTGALTGPTTTAGSWLLLPTLDTRSPGPPVIGLLLTVSQ